VIIKEGSGGEISMCNEESFNLHSSINTLNVDKPTRLRWDFYVIRKENVQWKAVTKKAERTKQEVLGNLIVCFSLTTY
jgi:hypothetical protein